MDTLIEFQPYTPELRAEWDRFVASSAKNSFLFTRAYMEYHSDRFKDASLVARRKGKICALLPATISLSGVLSSHAGLTYGGWITPMAHFDGSALLELFSCWVEYCRSQGYREILYKPLPHIYSPCSAEEDIYALFRCGFSLRSVNLSSAISLSSPLGFDMSKRQQVRKALKAGDVRIEESRDWAAYWQLLSRCLEERHQAAPVHSFEEITALAAALPGNIRLFTLSDSEGLQAGVCVYDTGLVAHSQYAATTERARRNYFLTLLYHHLITETFADGTHRWFDFGTSNLDGGRFLDSGLLAQKYAMGGRGVAYATYSLVF